MSWTNLLLFLKFRRKQEPMENVYASACSKSSTAMKHVYETPPQAIGHTTQPPPLTRGNRFGRLSYDDEDSNVPALESETNGNDVDALPLSSPVPAVGSSLCVAESSTATSTAIKTRKRILITDDVHKSPTKRSKSSPPSDIKKLEYFDKPSESELDLASTSTSTSVKSTGSCEQSSTNKLFTELRYLEAIGSIRTIRRSKHPGINRVPNAPHTTANDIAESVTPFISPESQNGWDRKTKLKISYRIDMSTQEIQYALIIYEPLTMVTRRNLMEEFQQAADEEANRTKSAEKLLQRPKSASKSRTTHLKSDKLLSLRRLRFWS